MAKYSTFVLDKLFIFEKVTDLMADDEKCGCSATERLKVPKAMTCGDAVAILSRTWRVHSVAETEKKALFYGKLMLEKEMVLSLRINSKKNAIQITARGAQQGFIDSVLREFKAMVMH